MYKISGKYFFGNEISEYGQQHNRVDYATLAKAFDAVMNNSILENTQEIGYWEPMTDCSYYEDYDGNRYDYDDAQQKIAELQEEMDMLESSVLKDSKTKERIAEIQENIDCLEDERFPEIYQWFIVSDRGADILQEIGEYVLYNETLDMYVWGVDHYGTSWDYVLTNIPCNCKEEA